MQLAFSWWQLFDVLLSILWLISGIRDLMGKDPLIRLPGISCLLAEEKRRVVYL